MKRTFKFSFILSVLYTLDSHRRGALTFYYAKSNRHFRKMRIVQHFNTKT